MSKVEKYIKIGNLSVSDELFKFINEELLPETKKSKRIFGKNLIICTRANSRK